MPPAPDSHRLAPDELLAAYRYDRASLGATAALQRMLAGMAGTPLPAWQACAAALADARLFDAALAVLQQAIARGPDAAEPRRQLGDTLRRAGEPESAEAVLRPLLAQHADAPAAMSLAEALRDQGKLSEAAALAAGVLRSGAKDAAAALSLLHFVSNCQRQPLAMELGLQALAAHPGDAQLLAFAGRQAVMLGRFDKARHHYEEAMSRGIDLNRIYVLQALSGLQRYTDPRHPDFALFETWRHDSRLTPLARAAVLFAIGKARDDLGDYAGAAAVLREGNALVRSTLSWSRQQWLDELERRLAEPPIMPASAVAAVTPVFVVGLPRSGTTLVADRLGRHPQVRNRGELALVPYLDKWLRSQPAAPALLERMAHFADAHLRQDDAPAHWYIDKNPLNFRHLGLIAAVLPNAKIIYCRRDPRDNALSIWSQFFARGDDNGYAYDFDDIAVYAAGCEALMRHWQQQRTLPILSLQYETLIESPAESFQAIQQFLGLPERDLLVGRGAADAVITTSSAWQARQEIYASSCARWRAYAPYLPELGRLG